MRPGAGRKKAARADGGPHEPRKKPGRARRKDEASFPGKAFSWTAHARARVRGAPASLEARFALRSWGGLEPQRGRCSEGSFGNGRGRTKAGQRLRGEDDPGALRAERRGRRRNGGDDGLRLGVRLSPVPRRECDSRSAASSAWGSGSVAHSLERWISGSTRPSTSGRMVNGSLMTAISSDSPSDSLAHAERQPGGSRRERRDTPGDGRLARIELAADSDGIAQTAVEREDDLGLVEPGRDVALAGGAPLDLDEGARRQRLAARRRQERGSGGSSAPAAPKNAAAAATSRCPPVERMKPPGLSPGRRRRSRGYEAAGTGTSARHLEAGHV